MEAHQVKIPTTAHYYTIGKPSKSVRQVFFVLHGYGQLASQIIHKFDAVAADTLVIAPEGLSRFYWDEKKGIVGASWMTKKDRLVAIEDYSRYLQYLYDLFVPQLHEEVVINILGFSQGGATAVRWLADTKTTVHNLILWGAGFPMDINYLDEQEYWEVLKKCVVIGKQDEYITAARLEKQAAFCEEQQLNFKSIWFEGKHVIDREVMYSLLKELS